MLQLLRLSPLLLATGCLHRAGTSERIARDMGVMPPNTVMLSQMMRELSAQPGFTEQMLQQIDKGSKSGLVFTPAMFDTFRKLTLGKDWEGLDRFPGWTIHRVTDTVNAGEDALKKETAPDADVLKVNLGPYRLDRAQNISLDTPSTEPGFTEQGLVEPLGRDVVRGDGGDPDLTPTHSESARLAQVLNRLSLNMFEPSRGKHPALFTASFDIRKAELPEQLIELLRVTGHSVTVVDARYFANFGHFHYKGQDVEMPFWLDTGLRVPAGHPWQSSRRYLIPVAHAEYEWIVRGPKINADVTFYFGIDGRAEFRTNDQMNQPWVLKRLAHEYTGADAVEVTRLTGSLLRAYAYLHTAHPTLPFGGYYTLGVCQDVVAAIEQHMTGTTTIFPNTADTKYFHDQPDEEVFRLMDAIPKDTEGKTPSPERIFGSLPTKDFSKLTVPGLREDTERTYDAWQSGHLNQRRNRGEWISYGGIVLATIVVAAIASSRRRRST